MCADGRKGKALAGVILTIIAIIIIIAIIVIPACLQKPAARDAPPSEHGATGNGVDSRGLVASDAVSENGFLETFSAGSTAKAEAGSRVFWRGGGGGQRSTRNKPNRQTQQGRVAGPTAAAPDSVLPSTKPHSGKPSISFFLSFFI